MEMQEKILVEFTSKQLRNVTFYYTVGLVATSYGIYKVTSWGVTKALNQLIELRNKRRMEEEEA